MLQSAVATNMDPGRGIVIQIPQADYDKTRTDNVSDVNLYNTVNKALGGLTGAETRLTANAMRGLTSAEMQLLVPYIKEVKQTGDISFDDPQAALSEFTDYINNWHTESRRIESQLQSAKEKQDAATRQKLTSELKSAMSTVL